MKTIIRIGDVIDTPEALAAHKISAFGARAFVNGFATLREDHPEALLIVDEDENKHPVYITVGSNPPELLAGDRSVFAVFSPPDAQEPIATFHDPDQANSWASSLPDPFVVRQIDSTDRLGVQASVAVILRREDQVLYCKLQSNNLWTLPEGTIEVGESVEAAGKRAVKKLLGIDIDALRIPSNVPYVNTFVERAAQHFLTCVLVGDCAGSETVKPCDPDGIVKSCDWFPVAVPPAPLFPTVQGIIRILMTPASPPDPVQE